MEELRPRLTQVTAALAHCFEGKTKQNLGENKLSTFPQKVKVLNYQIKNLSLKIRSVILKQKPLLYYRILLSNL